MALTSSHPFRLTASPAEPRRKPKNPKLVVQAKQDAPFSFKFGNRSSPEQDGPATKRADNQPDRFFLNFDGKLADLAKPLAPVVRSTSTSLFATTRRKDPNTIFVSGASGQTGVRIAQALLRKGFTVRAGVPDLAAAQELAQLAVNYKLISPEESKRLNAVQSPQGDAEGIAKAIGNASKVVVTVGRGENGPSGVVTADEALQVVRGAQLSAVRHVVLVYDVAGSGFSSGSTYNVLDGLTSFFSNLFSPTQPLTFTELLSKMAETGVSCTVLRASLADDYAVEAGRSIDVAPERSSAATSAAADTFKVSKSQVASLVADIFSNIGVAENRVVEVSTSPSANPKTIEELFSAIPEDGRRKAYREAQEKAKKEEEALIAAERAAEAAVAEKKPEKPPRKEAPVSKPAEETAGFPLNGDALRRATEGLNVDFSWEKLGLQLQAVAKLGRSDQEPKVQVATARGQAKARSLPPLMAVVKPPPPPPPAAAASPRKVFGGLFNQETIYIDDD